MVSGVVRARGMAEFTAECGGGKTALLHAVAPDAYIRVGRMGCEDFLQDAVREFFVHPAGGRRLSSRECHEALRRLGAVVALDDVVYGPREIAEVRSALAGCAILVGAERPVLGPAGGSHPLPGLAEPEALALVVRHLGRIITEAESLWVRRLVTAVGGRPLALRQAAALVRHDGHTFAGLAASAGADPSVLDEFAISAVGPAAKRLLAALALVEGTPIPARLVAAMADVPSAAEGFEALVAHALAERQGDRFALPAAKAESYLRLLHRHLHLGTAMRALALGIGAYDPSGGYARDAARAAHALLGHSEVCDEPRLPVGLAAAAERVLFVQGHWQAWRDVLDRGQFAALSARDTAAQAYFAHQQGTLHLLEGREAAARQSLTLALDLRTGLGDGAGAAVTRANLALVPAPPVTAVPAAPPVPAAGRLGRQALLAAVLTVVLLALGLSVGTGLFDRAGPGASAATADPSRRAPGPRPAGGGRVAQQGGAKAEMKPLRIVGRPDYGDVHVGAAGPGDSRVIAFTITNPNGRPITPDAITLPGPGPSGTGSSASGRPADFTITAGTCPAGDGAALAPGASCTVSVRFAPTALGPRTATLTVSCGAHGPAATARLTGHGFATIKVTLAPGRADPPHDHVTVTADGATTTCGGPGGCTVRYDDPRRPVILRTHGPGRGRGSAPGGWTGPCAGSHEECMPEPGGDISTSVRFHPSAGG